MRYYVIKKSVWKGPHGQAIAQPLRECVRLDHLSTAWTKLMSVQGNNTFIHTRLLGNKWQYKNDVSDVIGVCTEFMGHFETAEMENWNFQNENCLLCNTYLSKKTNCKTRPLELCHTVHTMQYSSEVLKFTL